MYLFFLSFIHKIYIHKCFIITHNSTFDLYFVKNGEALANKVNCVVRQLTLPAGETFTFDTEKIILEAGDRIFCIASPDIGSSLTDLAITVSYLEV